jgi:hypothetical protein
LELMHGLDEGARDAESQCPKAVVRVPLALAVNFITRLLF